MLNLKLKGLTMNKLREVHEEIQLQFHKRSKHPGLPPCNFLAQGVAWPRVALCSWHTWGIGRWETCWGQVAMVGKPGGLGGSQGADKSRCTGLNLSVFGTHTRTAFLAL